MSLPPVDEDRHVPAYLRALLGVDDEPLPMPTAIHREPDASRAPADDVPLPAPPPRIDDDRFIVARTRLAALFRSQRPTLSTLTGVVEAVAQHLVVDLGLSYEFARSLALAEAGTVYSELFTDKVAYDAIGAAIPAFRSVNPREIKRYVNLFRFYSFITFRRRASGATAPDDTQIAKLAAFAIRWPDLLGAIARFLPQLEEAADDDETWETTLDSLSCLPNAPARRAALRAFLAADPRIGTVAHTVL